MCAAVPDKETGSGHTCGEADSGNQRRTVNVFFNNVSEKSSRHAEKENGEAESPFGCTLGKTDIVGNLLAENRSTVNSTNAAVKQ